MDIVKLIRLEPHISNIKYRDAFQSYKEIYNNAMAKGKGTLQPRTLAGNPIQLNTSNMNSLFEMTENGIKYQDYFVSTKADGLRFMLLIGNKTISGFRNIYFVDSKMNFWYIGTKDGGDGIPTIPISLNVDKCLIDGELLFWGNITYKKNKNNEIVEYTLKKNKLGKPFIGFLAFDILYGPTNPDYVEQNGSKFLKFQLGSSGAMLGQKAVGRWPTTRRRAVLETMFLNTDSPLWRYLHVPGPTNLIKEYSSDIGGYETILKHSNFTIFISPFENMSKLLETYDLRVYGAMIKHLQSSIEKQYYWATIDFLDSVKGGVVDKNITRHQIELPSTPKKKAWGEGKGYLTDGLILTPAREAYLVGPWTFCNNKQYKWKPIDELTIDFQIGKKIGEKGDTKFYLGLIRYPVSKTIKPFEYEIGGVYFTAVIETTRSYDKKDKDIVECLCNKKREVNPNYLFFDLISERFDKEKPNPLLTAISVMNGANIKNELEYLEYDTTVYFQVGNQKNNDGTYVYTSSNIKKLNGRSVRILSSRELESGTVVGGVFERLTNGKIYFRKTKIYKNKEPDNAILAEKKLDELNKSSIKLDDDGTYKKTLPEIMDLIINIKERFDYLSEEQKENILLSFGKSRLLKCLVNEHPLSLFSEFERSKMVQLISEKQNNFDKYELELQLKFRTNRFYGDCLIKNFINSDYTPVPIIKSYGSNNVRSVYVSLGDTLMLEESMVKEKIDEVDVTNDIFNYDFDLVLSTENKIKKDVKNPKSFEYQNRYTITSLSKFWKIDIIEFGNARNRFKNSWGQAKKNWEQRPMTRVEFEYDPGAYFKDMSKWNDRRAIETLIGEEINEFKDLDDFRKHIDVYIKKLNKTEPIIILEDLGRLLTKVFTVLDMDLGNVNQRKKKKPDVISKRDMTGGLFKTMRKFHNSVKRDLITEVVQIFPKEENLKLMDISVGRGGDIDKWNSSNIKQVYGIDPSETSIKEARERYESGKSKNPKEYGYIAPNKNYKFDVLKITDTDASLSLMKEYENKFNIVSCQFTLHYFFENEKMLENAIKTVSTVLKTGGYFIGTVIVGNRIKEMDTKQVKIEFVGNDSYRFKLKDTEDSGNYFTLEDKLEYFVDFDYFERLCNEYGLVLIQRVEFGDLYKKWNKNKGKMTDYEYSVSSMYDRFIFEKVENDVDSEEEEF